MAARRSHLFPRLLRWIARLAFIALVSLGFVYLLPQKDPDGWLPQPARAIRWLDLDPADRILVLAPHPDDDILACGGLIQKALARRLPLHVAYLTNGDGNEWSFVTYTRSIPTRAGEILAMGDLRYQEAINGEAVLGAAPDQLTFLGYPDISTLEIFTSHWRTEPAARALLTRATAVPYPFALSPNAPYKGESILADVQRIIQTFKPTRIFVSHPLDRNPDHRAFYLYARVALWHLPSVRASLHPFLVHARGWPHPEGPHEDQELDPPVRFADRIDWTRQDLTRAEVAQKACALGAHQTQMSYSANYLQAFVRRNELFGDLDAIDLRVQPEQLISNETAPLAGQEWRYARLKDGRLEISLVYARPVARNTRAVLHLFGDRSDRPFAQMPKLTVRLDPFHVSVHDLSARLPVGEVRVIRVARRTTVSVPLEALGHPQRVLVSACSFLGEVELDYGWWATIEVGT